MQININNLKFQVVNEYLEFWQRVLIKKWEPYTFNIFDRFVTKDSIVLDVGAWIGPTTLYLSQIAKQVYAFEPDLDALKILKNNIELNNFKNITVITKALSDTNSFKYMKMLGNSESQVINFKKDDTDLIECITFDRFLEIMDLEKVDFIKIDIEGHERYLIPTMVNYLIKNQTPMLLSLHYDFFDDYVKNIFKTILFGCYNNIIDAKTDKKLNNDNIFGTDVMLLY
jgi:FkbM family methyltransferase